MTTTPGSTTVITCDRPPPAPQVNSEQMWMSWTGPAYRATCGWRWTSVRWWCIRSNADEDAQAHSEIEHNVSHGYQRRD